MTYSVVDIAAVEERAFLVGANPTRKCRSSKDGTYKPNPVSASQSHIDPACNGPPAQAV